MNIDRARWLALAVVPLLAACEHDLAGVESASSFGEANRQTMMAQVADPDPIYETADPATSAEHAGQAAERYRKDAVKKPERVRSTVSTSSGTR